MSVLRSVELFASADLAGNRQPLPFTFGVPLPRGLVFDESQLQTLDRDGRPLPSEVETVERWPDDGSLRWCLVRCVGREVPCRLDLLATSVPRPDAGPLASTEDPDDLRVDTGVAVFRLGANRALPFELEPSDGILAPAGTGLRLITADGHPLTLRREPARLVRNGSLSAELIQEASVVDPRDRLVARLAVVLSFFRGSGLVELALTLTNPERASHPRGKWQLGSGGSLYLGEITLQLGIQGNPLDVSLALDDRSPLRPTPLPLEVEQLSSAGPRWQSRVHLDRHAQVPLQERGYRLRRGAEIETGERASPVLFVTGPAERIAVGVESFWQAFPKRLALVDGRIEVGLLPPGQEHELQGGERFGHRVFLHLESRPGETVPPEVLRRPLRAWLPPDWYAEAQAVPFLVPAAADPNADYLALVDEALDGESDFFTKRETIDEYGWRHFGDLWADHEQVYSSDPAPLVSHYNNQYDALFGFGVHFLRTGDARWLQLMDDLAEHVVDIDLYHTERDKSAYNGGMFWHTFHYVDAGLSTHRSYPDDPRVPGGGPSAGHVYTSGLLLHYWLTGSRRSRDAVLQLGDWVIHADDGGRTIFRWLDSSPTGHISATGDDDFHGPGRSPGNALGVLVDCHRLSGDERYLDKAHELVRRTVHPEDELPDGPFTDVENRWSYTIFLQNLGKYLDHLEELDRRGPEWSYARASLLHWVRWAARHEYPYLDVPERLVYPTETWAAQELQKVLVFQTGFRWAAEAGERVFFAERARHFFDLALGSLRRMPTRTFTRPRVLLLTRGFSQAALDLGRLPTVDAPLEPFEVPPRGPFVPQKRRALARLRRLVLAAATTGTLVVALALWLLLR